MLDVTTHICLITHVNLLPASALQGLFRVAPSASKLKKLKASLDCGVLDVQEYSSDPHAIAGEVRRHESFALSP